MKKIVILILSVCFSLLLFGCGGSDVEKQREKSTLEKIVETEIDYSPKDKFVKWTPKVHKSNGFSSLIMSIMEVLTEYGSYILVVLLIIGIGFVVVRLIPVFHTTKSEEQDASAVDVSSNSIFEHNYRKEIDALVGRGDYRGAVRLLYLYTLYTMNECDAIKWDESKTPLEYYYEMKRTNLRSVFFRITSAFLNVVYGNAAADAEMFSRVNEDTRTIVKLLTPVNK